MKNCKVELINRDTKTVIITLTVPVWFVNLTFERNTIITRIMVYFAKKYNVEGIASI